MNNNFQDAQNPQNASNAPKIRKVDDLTYVPKNTNDKIKILPKQPNLATSNPNPNIQINKQPIQPIYQQPQQPSKPFISFGQQEQSQFQGPIYPSNPQNNFPQNNFPLQQNYPQNQQFGGQNLNTQYQPAFINQPVRQDNPYVHNPQQTQTQQSQFNPSQNYIQEKSNLMFPQAAGVMNFDGNRNSIPPQVNTSPIYEQKPYQQRQEPQNIPIIYNQQQNQKNQQPPSWQLTPDERDELSIKILTAFQQADENRRKKQKNR
ncbi:hypothetical protein pb186bvf_018040 [Paramecium bursaria]